MQCFGQCSAVPGYRRRHGLQWAEPGMTRFDIVVVCHARDLRMLQLQARSIARYFPTAMLGSIFVIENDTDSEAFEKEFVRTVLPDYGFLRSAVRFVRRDTLLPGDWPADGWRSQQVLKMLASGLGDAEYLLILDAKNHFVRPVTSDSYQAQDGRLRSYVMPQSGHLEHLFRHSFKAFGLDPDDFIACSLPNLTPFPAKRSTIIEMMARVGASDGSSFTDYFLRNEVAEFYLLAAYIAARDGEFSREYALGDVSALTVFPDKTEAATFLWVDLNMRHDRTICFGVHWQAIAPMLPEQKQAIAKFWFERGLVLGVAEGLTFLE